ncbi:hypothetical protein D3C71_1317260 [compost metagenome]
MQDGLAHLFRNAFRIAVGRAFPGKLRQRLLRIEARYDRLLRVLVLQLRHVEAAALDNLAGAGQRLRIFRKKPVHFLRRLQEAVGMALAVEADIVDRRVIADTGDDVLHLPATRLMEEHVIGDHSLHFVPYGEVRQIMETQPIVRASAQAQAHVGAIAEDLRDLPQLAGIDFIRLVGDENGDQPFAIGFDIGEIEDALAFSAPALSQ